MVGKKTLLRLTTLKKLLLEIVVIRRDCGKNKSDEAEGGERAQQRIVTTSATRAAGEQWLRFDSALRAVGCGIHDNLVRCGLHSESG